MGELEDISGAPFSKFLRYCEAIELLTQQSQAYYQYCPRDQAAVVYRRTKGSKVNTVNKFWVSKSGEVEVFLKEFKGQFPDGIGIDWELYPEDEIIAELAAKYPEEYPDGSGLQMDSLKLADGVTEIQDESRASSETFFGNESSSGEIVNSDHGPIDPKAPLVGSGMLICPSKLESGNTTSEPTINSPRRAHFSRFHLLLYSLVIAIVCVAAVATIVLVKENYSKTAVLEDINSLSAEAYQTVKTAPESQWTIEALQNLSRDIQANGIQETQRRLAQIELFLYWLRKHNEDPTYFNKALLQLPSSGNCEYPEILLLRGQIRLSEFDGAGAEVEFDAGLKLKCEHRLNLELLIGRASSLAMQEIPDKAIAEIDDVIPKIRSLANNDILVRKALLIRAESYVAQGGKLNVLPALEDLASVLHELDEDALVKVTSPLSLTVVVNDLYRLGQDSGKHENIVLLRNLIKSHVIQFGNTGKETVDGNRLQRFIEAANHNLAGELKNEWAISVKQYRLAKGIIETPGLIKFISDEEVAKFKSNDLNIAAKLSDSPLKSAYERMDGYRDMIKDTPMSELEKSVFSLMSLENAFSIFRFELLTQDQSDFDFLDFAGDMSVDLQRIASLPDTYPDRVANFSKQLNKMVDDAESDHRGFKRAVDFKAKFDNHDFRYEKTILE